jgi:hypothetical protein
MKQLTLDFFFCNKKRERDDSDLEEDDILECFEKAKKEQEEEENQKLMELIWEDFEEEFLEEMAQREYFCSGEAAKDYAIEEERRTPYKGELTPEERIERCWKVQQIDFKLPQNFTYSRWYWDASEDMKMQQRIKSELNSKYLQ